MNSASFDNIRLWDLENNVADNVSTVGQKKKDDTIQFDGGVGGDGMYQDDLFPLMTHNDDPYDMNLFGGGDHQLEQKERKLQMDTEMLLDQDLLAPSVPFTIVPGRMLLTLFLTIVDHGGVISSLCNQAFLCISHSFIFRFDGQVFDICFRK